MVRIGDVGEVKEADKPKAKQEKEVETKRKVRLQASDIEVGSTEWMSFPGVLPDLRWSQTPKNKSPL